MRLFSISLAAALIAATPALADEARVEARGGIAFGNGESETFVGGAVGYDFDLGDAAFLGAEISGDKFLDSNAGRIGIGLTGRVGTRLGGGKLYANGGYTTKFCASCDETWHAGVGYEHGLGGGLYGKVEYRHYFVDGGGDIDAVGVGLGVRF